MKRWKMLLSSVLSAAMIVSTVYTMPLSQSTLLEAAENGTKEDTIFTDEQGNAVFNEETNEALESFTDEFLDMLAKYPVEDMDETGEQEFLTKRLIVKSAEDFDTYGAVAEADGYRGITILQYDTEEAARDAYERLEQDDVIDYVETDVLMETADTGEVSAPDSSLKLEGQISGSYLTSAMQVKSSFTSWGGSVIRAQNFNRMLKAKKDTLPVVVAAVLDTGIDYSHPLLANRVIHHDVNYSGDGEADDVYSYNPHGTAVAGIIADLTLDNVLIKPYKVMRSNGKGSESTICVGWLQAIEDQVDVINISLGGEGNGKLLEEMAALSEEADIPVVVAAGNDAENTADHTPANIASCITVSSMDSDYKIDSMSNTGNEVDLAAPGADIKVAQNDGTYKVSSGTSFAAPHVTAAIAMLFSYDETMSGKAAYVNLINHAADYGDEGFDTKFGYGLLNMDFDTMSDYVSAPVIQTEGGAYDSPVKVTISSKDGNDIYYFYEGSMPEPVKYTKPVTLNKSEKLVAYCVKNGVQSERVNRTYMIGDTMLESECKIDADGTLTEYKVEQSRVEVPKTIQGIPVTAVRAAMPYVEELVLPDSVQSVFCYRDCNMPYLKTVEVADDSPYLKTVDGVLYNKDVTKVLLCPAQKTGSLKLPDTVTVIGDAAFYCSKLSSLTLPSALKEIDDAAFWLCSFEKLHLPAGVQTIAKGALQYPETKGIHSVTIDAKNPYFVVQNEVLYTKDKTRLLYYGRNKKTTDYKIASTVTEIDVAAFTDNTYLKTLTVPESVELLEWVMIGNETCTALTDIYFMGNMPYRIGAMKRFDSSMFGGVPFGATAKVTIHHLKGAEGFDTIISSGGVYGDRKLNYKIVEETTTYDNPLIEMQATLKELQYSSNTETGNSKTVTLMFNRKTGTIIEPVSTSDWYNYSKLEIPASVGGVKVTKIGRDAFRNVTKLVNISMPDTVTKIENQAFYGCYRLAGVDFPAELTYIGDDAFHGCTSLSKVTSTTRSLLVLPEKLTYIGEQAFWNTQYFQIVIPDSVTYIGDGAFGDPYENYLRAACFKGTIPHIGQNAFGTQAQGILCYYSGATKLEQEEINGYTWKQIPEGYDLTSIKSIEYTDKTTSVTYVYHPITGSLGIVSENSELTELTIPSTISGNKVTALECNLIRNMNALEKIVVPAGVEKLEFGSLALENQNHVIEFMGDAPELLTEEAFGKTENRDNFEIWYHQDDAGYTSGYYTSWRTVKCTDGRFITYVDKTQNVTWKFDTYYHEISLAKGTPQQLSVPAAIQGYAVEAVAYEAFADCTTLKKLTLPDTVRKIGNSACKGCTALTSVTMPKKLTELGAFAFNDCTSLKSVTIPANVETLKRFAFADCTALTTVELSENLQVIEESALRGCTALKKIVIPAGVTKIGSSALGYKSGSDKMDSYTICGYGNEGAAYSYAKSNSMTYVNLTVDEEATATTLSESNTSITVTAKVTYTGAALTPNVSVKYNGKALTADTDYSVAYMNNINPGQAYVLVKGKGSYKGTVVKSFQIATDASALTSLSGTIVWSDSNDAQKDRPDYVLVKLYADGELSESKVVRSASGNSWAFSFENLPAKKNGTKVVYSVEQTKVSDYQTTISGTTIKNVYIPKPSASPSTAPSASPSATPSTKPSAAASASPSASAKPSASPSATSSAKPSATPSVSPSAAPSATSSAKPSATPSATSSAKPSASPSVAPSTTPSVSPSDVPSAAPSTTPDNGSGDNPTTSPSLTPSTPPDEPSGGDKVKGDVDGDDQVTLQDAQLVLKAALRIIGLPEEASADVNGDGQITLQDAQIVLKVALRILKL